MNFDWSGLVWVGVAWVAGGYAVGTIPSTLLVARARGATEVLRHASRTAGEADAHILLTEHAGSRWSGVAAAADVLKALLYALLARAAGLEPSWLAAVGVALVVGYCWPPYATRLAGRGLAVTAGVYLALLPLSMLVMGLMILAGAALRSTGAWSTLGLVSVPCTAALLDAPGPLVLMSLLILALILLRRIEGVRADAAAGAPLGRAMWRRAVLDASS